MSHHDRLVVRLAESDADVAAARRLIAAEYGRQYGVRFSDDHLDLEAKIEPWPHRFLGGWIGERIVCATGIYLHGTYVERFGDVSDADIGALLSAAGAGGRYSALRKREVTRLVVHPDWRGRGFARLLFAASHSRAFLQLGGGDPSVVLVCAKLSIFRAMHDAVGIGSRRIKEFPRYRAHELYRSAADPMESRLVIPDLDIPAACYAQALPLTKPTAPKHDGRARAVRDSPA